MITEIAILQLPAGIDLGHASSPGSKVVEERLAQVLPAEGARHAYYGQSIEQPSVAFVAVGWDSLEDYKMFKGASDYPDHIAKFMSDIRADIAPTILHVPFSPIEDPSPALGADTRVGVTEVVLYHFPSPLTTKNSIMDYIDKMRPVMEGSEACAIFDGWALGESQNEKREMEATYVNLVGWVDVEAHVRSSDREEFKENIHHLLGIEELKGLELHHVKFFRV